jgi:hypothetical protein
VLKVLEPGALFNGGISPPGSRVAHDFVLENTGDTPLSIESVVPGCGCTIASYDNFIPPGRTGKVSVTVDLYREWAGQDYVKVVTVISNDSVSPRLRLGMKGKVGMSLDPSDYVQAPDADPTDGGPAPDGDPSARAGAGPDATGGAGGADATAPAEEGAPTT